MSNEMMKREMQEAVQAGERALQSLYAARDKLGSARNWGIFDMLGGGFISDFVKHSKMNDAAALMESAGNSPHIPIISSKRYFVVSGLIK